MKKQIIFSGVATALITPFKDGRVDYDALGALIEMQIDAGIDALVIGGTTGEAATLSDMERYSLFDFSKKEIKNRCKLILGTGTNDTAGAVRHTLYASRLGCDGVLVVTPYYNKGTKEGVIRHYLKIAESSDVPVLLYNVPSRTGVTLDIELLRELSKCERIVGIKEATDSEDRHLLLSAFGEELWLYSGNDSQIYSTLALGGLGVVSVVSNLYPRETKEICDSFFKGDRKKSLELQLRLMPVINALFLDTNPAPIKFAMSQKGLCHPDMRLPMWLPTPVCQERIRSAIAEFEKENK